MMADRRWIVLVLCGWLFVPATARAQALGGSIAGVVRDASGGVLPGVTVEAASPALIEKTRSVLTDGQGNYKITDLRPGVYSVTFTLSGFASIVREGIELTTGFTAPVNADLKVGAVEERITVTGASPVVDVQTARTRQMLKAETLDALPAGMKDMTAMVTLTLGATTSTLRNDVGGNQGELSTGISIHGSRGDDSRTNYDGMNTNVFYGGAGGQQRIYKFNTVGVTETVIDTGASAADTETGGANINMVPKDGGNKFSVSGVLNYSGNKLSSGRVPQEFLDRGSADNQNSVKKIFDYGLGVGGPIKQDKIWFYSANRYWGNQGYGANNYFNKSTLFYKYDPDLSRPVYSDQYYKDFGGRITLQATPKNKITFSENYQTACACWMGIGGTTAPESSTSYVYGPEYLTQATWTNPVTNRLLLQAGFSYLRQAVQFTSQGAPNAPGQIAITDSNYPGIGAYTWGGLTGGVSNDNYEPQQNDNLGYRASAAYITGTHAVKVGVQGQWGMYNTRGNVPGNGTTYGFVGGVPNTISEWATPFKSNGRITNIGLYASDQWNFHRMTLSYGARYDHFTAYTLAIDLPAGPFIGTRHFDAAKNIPNYNDITPRVGVAYDVFGNGKTALKASWGRYLIGLGGGSLTTLSPSNAIATNTSRPWVDAVGVVNPATGVAGNGNFVPDCDLKNPQANGECGVINNFAFGTPNLTVSWDPRASTGWGVREYNNQWSLSAQQEIRAGWAVSAGFYHTDWQNGQVAVNTAVAATDFDTYCITAPSDSRLGDVSGQQVCGLTNVNFAQKSTAPKTVWMRPQDVTGLSGQRTDVYNGFDLSMNTRFRQSGVLAGGISVGREVTNNCFANAFPNVTGYVSAGASSVFGNRDPKYCETKSPLWQGVGSQVKFQVVYPLKYDFVVSGTYKNLPGIPITATITVPDAAVAASLGRNLSACAAPTGACTQVASVSVVYPQSVFDRRLNEVDSRLSRRFKLGKTRVNGVIELYNVFNARTPQANVTTWGTLATPVSAAAPAASYLRPTAFLGGRLLKFGFQFDL